MIIIIINTVIITVEFCEKEDALLNDKSTV